MKNGTARVKTQSENWKIKEMGKEWNSKKTLFRDL